MSGINLEQRVKQLELLHRISSSANVVLQYSCKIGDLRVWKWPVTARGERVTPSDLRDHRQTHRFAGPRCICPAVIENQRCHEAAIVVVKSGRFFGEFVAQCAEDKCGYFVLLERIHSKFGVPVKKYEPRDPGEPRPPLVLHISERVPVMQSTAIATVPRPLTRSYALLDIDNTLDVPPKIPANRAANTSALLKLLQLDAAIRPGLSQAHFRALFVRCTCRLITTRRAYHAHYCIKEPEVIDLTDINNSDSDSEMEVIDLTTVTDED